MVIGQHMQRGASVLTPRGFLDVSTYPELRDALLKCASDGPAAIMVDLAGLEVDRISTLSVFPTVWMRTSVWPGVPVVLAGARAPLDAMLASSAVPRFLACHATTAIALDSIGHPPPRRRSEIELPHDVASSRVARQWLCEQMDRFELPDCETATLVATELVDNAIQHALSSCKLRLELHPLGLSIAVSDADPRPPVLHSREVATARAEFGMSLIEMLSRAWGCSPRWDGGKVVWAVLPVAGGPGTPIDPPGPAAPGLSSPGQ